MVSVPQSATAPHEKEGRPMNPAASEWQPSNIKNFQELQPDIAFMRGFPKNGQGGMMPPETLLGKWADSLGNSVHVFSVDAYQVRLMATLSQPPRPDIHLTIRPMPGGGWICGNAMLDPAWSLPTQLHWLTADGRISVWVRLDKGVAVTES